MVERRTGEDGSFLADGLGGSAPSLVFGTGRVCIEPTCGARLSRYNSTEWCALHESPASTQRPYDTSTRQRGRRRNTSTRRRRSVAARATSATTSASSEDRKATAGSAAGSAAGSTSGSNSGSNSGSTRRAADTDSRRASDPGKARRSTAA